MAELTLAAPKYGGALKKITQYQTVGCKPTKQRVPLLHLRFSSGNLKMPAMQSRLVSESQSRNCVRR